jgi:hypothetical protein
MRSRWTGRLTFVLIDSGRAPAHHLDVEVGRDVVALWLGAHNLAMIDRDRVRNWAVQPRATLERHEVVLSTVDAWIAVVIGDEPPTWILPADSARLRSVL